MRIEKMLAALLAGLITLSLAGCAADKANDNTESGAVSTESSITATETDKASGRIYGRKRKGKQYGPCR